MIKGIILSDAKYKVEQMEDCQEKETLLELIQEYVQYTKCGTVEECWERKIAHSDIAKNIANALYGIQGIRKDIAGFIVDTDNARKSNV